MYIDPNRYSGRPTADRIPQELAIPYIRVDHDHADTIEFCLEVEQVLGAKICKNLFLCNRQQTVLSFDDAGGQALQDQVPVCPAGVYPAILC